MRMADKEKSSLKFLASCYLQKYKRIVYAVERKVETKRKKTQYIRNTRHDKNIYSDIVIHVNRLNLSLRNSVVNCFR